MDKNVPAQEIRSLAITGADHIGVEEYKSFINLYCYAKNGNLVEQINFKTSEVKEYVCQSIVWEPNPASPNFIHAGELKTTCTVFNCQACTRLEEDNK